jgi:hypothetical protein
MYRFRVLFLFSTLSSRRRLSLLLEPFAVRLLVAFMPVESQRFSFYIPGNVVGRGPTGGNKRVTLNARELRRSRVERGRSSDRQLATNLPLLLKMPVGGWPLSNHRKLELSPARWEFNQPLMHALLQSRAGIVESCKLVQLVLLRICRQTDAKFRALPQCESGAYGIRTRDLLNAIEARSPFFGCRAAPVLSGISQEIA